MRRDGGWRQQQLAGNESETFIKDATGKGWVAEDPNPAPQPLTSLMPGVIFDLSGRQMKATLRWAESNG